MGAYCPAGSRLNGYIYRNGTNVSPGGGSRLLFEVEAYSGWAVTPVSSMMFDTPNTTSQTTYTVYFCSTNGSSTVYLLNNPPGYGNIQLTAMEIAA